MKAAIFIFFISISSLGKTNVNDTISNWQFYIDDSLAVALCEPMVGYEYLILKSELAQYEQMTFVMNHCTYCPDCTYELRVNEFSGNLIWSKKSKENKATVIDIIDILNVCEEKNICSFDIVYYSNRNSNLPLARHVLRLELN